MNVYAAPKIESSSRRSKARDVKCPTSELVTRTVTSPSELQQPQPHTPHAAMRYAKYRLDGGELPTKRSPPFCDEDVMRGQTGIVQQDLDTFGSLGYERLVVSVALEVISVFGVNQRVDGRSDFAIYKGVFGGDPCEFPRETFQDGLTHR